VIFHVPLVIKQYSLVPASPPVTYWQYMGEVWLTVYIAELCLHSLLAQGRLKTDEY